MTGKATTTLMQKADSTLLSFSGQTASGVKLEGSVTCRKMSKWGHCCFSAENQELSPFCKPLIRWPYQRPA